MKGVCILIFYIIIFYQADLIAQSLSNREDNRILKMDGFPEIGEKCPDFVLNNVLNFPKNKVSLKDLEGKPFILDFFSTGCSSCFEKFPYINEFQKEFKNKLQFILVGHTDKYIKAYFERYREKWRLDVPYVYDSTFAKRFADSRYPTLLWVDRNGIVKAITPGDLTRENLQAFIEGKELQVTDISYKAMERLSKEIENKKFDWYSPDGYLSKDSNFLVKSEIGFFNRTMTRHDVHILGTSNFYKKISRENKLDSGKVIAGIGNLEKLYAIAYSGNASLASFMQSYLETSFKLYDSIDISEPVVTVYPRFILNVKDAELFLKKNKDSYWYKLIVPNPPSPSSDFLLKIMQNNLRSYFGYEACSETRVMPYYRLVADEGATSKLATKGGKCYAFISMGGILLRNHTPLRLTNLLNRFLGTSKSGLQIIDETGITERIDIQFPAAFGNLEDVKSNLNRFGLDLIKSEKPMKVWILKNVEN